MSTAVASRPRIHIPWVTIVIVLVAVPAAAAVLVLIDRPTEMAFETSPTVLAAPGAAVVPKPETRGEILSLTGRAPAAHARTVVPAARHDLVIGTSLDPVNPSSPRRSHP
jgi:hypothetical protein